MDLKIFKKPKKELRVLFASAEVAPFSKVGGLADVVGELPLYLDKQDVECAVFTPLYGCIDEEKYGIKELENQELCYIIYCGYYQFNRCYNVFSTCSSL